MGTSNTCIIPVQTLIQMHTLICKEVTFEKRKMCVYGSLTPSKTNHLAYIIHVACVAVPTMLQCHSYTRERECILKAQVPGVSMRPPLCTDADDLLCCSATVGNLGERGEPDILT